MRTMRQWVVGLMVGILAAVATVPTVLGQDSTATGPAPGGGLWAVGVSLLVQNQYAVAVAGSSLLLYAFAQVPWFRNLGDWTKRAAHFLSAFAVVTVIRALGGEVSTDVASLLGAGGASLAASVAGMIAFRTGRTQPGNR